MKYLIFTIVMFPSVMLTSPSMAQDEDFGDPDATYIGTAGVYGALLHLHDLGCGDIVVLGTDWQDMPIVGFVMQGRTPNAPAVLLTGAMHGSENGGAVMVLNTLYRLCQDFRCSGLPYRVLAVPVLNPYGFANDMRFTMGGDPPGYVDPNREFGLAANQRPYVSQLARTVMHFLRLGSVMAYVDYHTMARMAFFPLAYPASPETPDRELFVPIVGLYSDLGWDTYFDTPPPYYASGLEADAAYGLLGIPAWTVELTQFEDPTEDYDAHHDVLLDALNLLQSRMVKVRFTGEDGSPVKAAIRLKSGRVVYANLGGTAYAVVGDTRNATVYAPGFRPQNIVLDGTDMEVTLEPAPPDSRMRPYALISMWKEHDLFDNPGWPVINVPVPADETGTMAPLVMIGDATATIDMGAHSRCGPIQVTWDSTDSSVTPYIQVSRHRYGPFGDLVPASKDGATVPACDESFRYVRIHNPSAAVLTITDLSVPYSSVEYDMDGDGYRTPLDCDDLDPDTHPGATELADGLDNDCNGIRDDGLDGDGDGFAPHQGDRDDSSMADTPMPYSTDTCLPWGGRCFDATPLTADCPAQPDESDADSGSDSACSCSTPAGRTPVPWQIIAALAAILMTVRRTV